MAYGFKRCRETRCGFLSLIAAEKEEVVAVGECYSYHSSSS